MAVTVTDNRTIQYQDGLTGITGADTSITDFYAEATGSAGIAINITTGQIYYGSSLDTTATGNEMLYVWSAVVATLNGYKEATAADSSHAQYVGDGTNNFIVYQAGNDRDVFKHASGQVSFQCFLIDMDYLSTANTNGDVAFLDGSFASLNEASITRIGAHYTTLSKALGGGQNCYLDIIRSGGADDGISITGGTTGDRGTFEEICIEDRSDLNGKAHGIIREYTGGAYGCQGTLKFGTTATGDSWFDDSAFSLTFEDRLVADDKYKIVVLGNTGVGEETHHILTNGTIQSARPGVTIDASSTGINTLTWTGVTFLNLKQPISLPTDSASYSHSVTNCTFNNCGQITIGTAPFTNNTILNYEGTAGTAAILHNQNLDLDGEIDGLTATKGTAATHVIELGANCPTAITLKDWTVSGYNAANGNNDSVIYNNSNKAITVSVTGNSGTISYRNGGTSTTTISQSVGVSVTIVDRAGDPIQNVQVSVFLTSDDTQVMNTDTNASGVASTTFAGATPAACYIRWRKSSTGSTRYVSDSATGTIAASTGLTAQFVMRTDTIAAT